MNKRNYSHNLIVHIKRSCSGVRETQNDNRSCHGQTSWDKFCTFGTLVHLPNANTTSPT